MSKKAIKTKKKVLYVHSKRFKNLKEGSIAGLYMLKCQSK